jgi:hypothetical protein
MTLKDPNGELVNPVGSTTKLPGENPVIPLVVDTNVSV